MVLIIEERFRLMILIHNATSDSADGQSKKSELKKNRIKLKKMTANKKPS